MIMMMVAMMMMMVVRRMMMVYDVDGDGQMEPGHLSRLASSLARAAAPCRTAPRRQRRRAGGADGYYVVPGVFGLNPPTVTRARAPRRPQLHYA
jgi:hypothetical protein